MKISSSPDLISEWQKKKKNLSLSRTQRYESLVTTSSTPSGGKSIYDLISHQYTKSKAIFK